MEPTVLLDFNSNAQKAHFLCFQLVVVITHSTHSDERDTKEHEYRCALCGSVAVRRLAPPHTVLLPPPQAAMPNKSKQQAIAKTMKAKKATSAASRRGT